MASPQGSQKLASQFLLKTYDFDPDSTSKVDVSWQDMRDFGNFAIIFIRTVGTGNVDTFDLLANPSSDGSGTDVTIKSHAVGSEPNAQADHIWLECTAEEVRQEGEDAGSDLRYVSANVEFAASGDEGAIVYIFGNGRWSYDSLSGDVVA